jgi:hypothetical protein
MTEMQVLQDQKIRHALATFVHPCTAEGGGVTSGPISGFAHQ